jgi:hypothetical protein
MLSCCTQFFVHVLIISILIISIRTMYTFNDNEYRNTTRNSTLWPLQLLYSREMHMYYCLM